MGIYCTYYNTVRHIIMKKKQYRESVYIQGVSGGIVNILGGGSMDYSE
jgi:hypothetical protein